MRNLFAFCGDQRRRQQIVCGFVAAVLAVVLGSSGAYAFVGDVVGVELDAVTCTNTTTGATAAGDIFPGGVYDCETIPTLSGNLVEVTLSGVASSGNPDCQDVMENAAAPPVVTLTEGACCNFIGSSASGFGDINNPASDFEIDAFGLVVSDLTVVRLSASGQPGVEFVHLITDGVGITLNCFLTAESCRGALIAPVSVIAFSASAPGPYALEVRVVKTLDNAVRASRGMSSSDDLAEIAEDAMRQFFDQ